LVNQFLIQNLIEKSSIILILESVALKNESGFLIQYFGNHKKLKTFEFSIHFDQKTRYMLRNKVNNRFIFNKATAINNFVQRKTAMK
jgi:hypothetical protein